MSETRPAPGFHHLHLNSVDPEAAIAFYVQQFPRSRQTSWGGLPALAAPNDVLVLFTRVAAAPATSPQTAIWHFGWHVTDTHKSLASYKGRPDGPDARLDEGADRRGQGQRRAADAHRRLRVLARSRRCARRIRGQSFR